MGADAATPPKKSKAALYIGIVVVLLIIAGMGYYAYQYGQTCILSDPSPLPGVKAAGFCGKTNHTFNSYNGWIARAPSLKKATDVGSCASNCSKTPQCTAFAWNVSGNACTLFVAPKNKADAIKGVASDPNWTSGLKMVSRANPWGK